MWSVDLDKEVKTNGYTDSNLNRVDNYPGSVWKNPGPLVIIIVLYALLSLIAEIAY